MGLAAATSTTGRDLVAIYNLTSRSDTADVAYARWSADGGATWTEPVEWACKFEATGGTGRRHPRGGYVDPATGRYITFWTQGVLPTDEPLEGLSHWTVWYEVSNDGGKTSLARGQVIHEGAGYDAIHHLPDVRVGSNCVMIGDRTQCPMTRSDGVIMMPVQASQAGPDGRYVNPGGGYTWTDAMVLMGRWKADGSLSWRCSSRVSIDPALSTRGLIEPTLAELSDGRMLMVMRGGNQSSGKGPDAPRPAGHKWASFSDDGGEAWTAPKPWTYSDAQPFFSPSACSQLIDHPDGRLFWMGNICEQNPFGNSPRYPMMLAEVDRNTGLLLRESASVVDDRQEGESTSLTLSNFHVRVEEGSGDLLLYMPRFFAKGAGSPPNFEADLLEYRVRV